MDNKKLNEQESLELITQMIQNTKFKMVKNAGTPFLVWGYMTVVTSLLIWYLLKETGNYCWQFFWLLFLTGFWMKHFLPHRLADYIILHLALHCFLKDGIRSTRRRKECEFVVKNRYSSFWRNCNGFCHAWRLTCNPDHQG